MSFDTTAEPPPSTRPVAPSRVADRRFRCPPPWKRSLLTGARTSARFGVAARHPRTSCGRSVGSIATGDRGCLEENASMSVADELVMRAPGLDEWERVHEWASRASGRSPRSVRRTRSERDDDATACRLRYRRSGCRTRDARPPTAVWRPASSARTRLRVRDPFLSAHLAGHAPAEVGPEVVVASVDGAGEHWIDADGPVDVVPVLARYTQDCGGCSP